MYKLKEVARRGTALLAAIGLLSGIGASAIPPSLASADALNPLTERSLLLSSSSPGWSAVDGSGNPTYAPPNSGANGQKTGETYSFKVSSTATIKAFTFQFCTKAAGLCTAPGDDAAATPVGSDDASHSDLNVVADTTNVPKEVTSADWTTISASADQIPLPDDSQGNYVVLKNVAGTWTYSAGWSTMTATNKEDGPSPTTKKNYITLTNSTGEALTAQQAVKVVFFATNKNYITNPGSGAFFVKINDYNSSTLQDGTTLVDGGVTVANIMNESIQIQTKVLETMDFSVGIIDPDSLPPSDLPGTAHGSCDPIMTRAPGVSTGPANSLFLGDQSAENSLATGQSYDTHSFWRLSSNSSGGATVYYSGVTLSNTEGNQIAPIGTTAKAPKTGTEQFGLAIDNIPAGTNPKMPVDSTKTGTDSSPSNGGVLDSTPTTPVGGDWVSLITAHASDTPDYWHNPQLYPLVPAAAYAGGSGTIDGTGTSATFAFDPNANTVPTPIASENTQVVDCVTAKMRYIGNIAATTPAGIYATKINYLAAPQY